MFNFNAVVGLLMRHWYHTIHHLDRLLDLFLGPVIGILLWGFLSVYLRGGAGIPDALGLFLGAIIMWHIFHVMSFDLSVSFNFDIWQRNILNIFTAPLNFKDYLASLFTISAIKMGISFIIMSLLSVFFFNFNVFELGLVMGGFLLSLMIAGLASGLFSMGIVMRFGSRAGPMSWWIPIIVQAFSAVFYPVEVLPLWAKTISLSLPTTYAFEGMRKVLLEGIFPANDLLMALILSLFYLILATMFIFRVFNVSKEKGFLLKLE